jgi:hypothetical protein
MKGDDITFEQYFAKKYPKQTEEQKILVTAICNVAFSSFQDEWLDRQVEQHELAAKRAQRRCVTQASPVSSEAKKAPRRIDRALHGGSGNTGRLGNTGSSKVGSAAPHGSESFRLADERPMGSAHWVKDLTAGGYGPGHSLSELSGAKQPKFFEDVMPTDIFIKMRRSDLLGLMDKATNPGNFLRAMLAYYGHSWTVPLGNIGNINSANINNPENIRSMCNLDTIFRYMQKIDTHKILTSERSTRFLVLCNQLLSEVKIKEPRTRDRLTETTIYQQYRDLTAAKSQIQDLTNKACYESRIGEDAMLIRISADKRARMQNYIISYTPKPTGTEP